MNLEKNLIDCRYCALYLEDSLFDDDLKGHCFNDQRVFPYFCRYYQPEDPEAYLYPCECWITPRISEDDLLAWMDRESLYYSGRSVYCRK